MIQKFVDKFMASKETLRTVFSVKHPHDYKAIVKAVIEVVTDADFGPDPTRIHQIDDGDYQGTLLFVIAAKGYEPSNYWYVKVSYGSCSGCDTLEGVREYESGEPTQKQVDEYLTLALHIVQGLKEL